MSSPDPKDKDLTPESAAPTDVAPLGRHDEKPSHERTATEDGDPVDWDAISADPDFKKLLADKARFVIPATIFFAAYYFLFLVLVGWFPQLMETEILGKVNLAYLLALSQFFMAWILAFLYVAAAAGWDRQASALLAKFFRKSS